MIKFHSNLTENASIYLSQLAPIVRYSKIFCFSDHPAHSVLIHRLKHSLNAIKETWIWYSLNLIECLLCIADTGLYLIILEQFKYDIQRFAVLIFLGLLQLHRRLYPNVAIYLYLQSQIQAAFTYRHLTLNLTDNEAQNIATLQWHEQSMEMTEGLYQIENIFGHKFVIIREEDNRVYIGNAVPLEQCIFRLEHIRHREYRVRHYQSNRTLCIYQQSLNNEAPIVLDSHMDQTFTFVSVDDDNREYYISPAHQRPISRSKVLDIHNDPYGHAGQNGAQVQLYSYHGGLNQRFRLHAVDENILTSTSTTAKMV
ncbi:unnamed protein product [Rotaria sp. Silwood2]|nr:unnamed protein product [Rotaria sp. Silwood2]CAF3872475.1 unnamed protein product [Rotaria sp. Silwood2]